MRLFRARGVGAGVEGAHRKEMGMENLFQYDPEDDDYYETKEYEDNSSENRCTTHRARSKSLFEPWADPGADRWCVPAIT